MCAMASRVWLLVEWVDQSDCFPAYDIVNVDTLAYDETDLHPGNLIFIRIKHENPRKARILRISGRKRHVKEHREFLERQDQKVKNVIQLCMQTLKEMRTENSFTTQQKRSSRSPLPHVLVAQNDNRDSDSDSEFTTQQKTSSHSPFPHVVVAQNDNSDSDSDSESNINAARNKTRKFSKSRQTFSPPFNRKESTGKHGRGSFKANYSRRRSIISSTPIPRSTAHEILRLCSDQATQTEAEAPHIVSAIEELEGNLKYLYKKVLSMVSEGNVNLNSSTSLSESAHNDEVSYIELNVGDSWVGPNNAEYMPQVRLFSPELVGEIGAEEVIEYNGGDQEQLNSSIVKNEDKGNPNALRVRRMSAQTTNNIDTVNDLVPIGNGIAKVPRRLLNDIDWKSHTTATRQLLQAIFPRRVLATHSLTGKQSPAFLNRPPKKMLDPQVVDDIVKTVSTKCGVPKSLVRNSITIKCTDEAKLYRNRQRSKPACKPLHENGENVPPSTPSSDESHAVMKRI